MSFGAGSTGAGIVAAGFDPAGTVGTARDVVPPHALYLDPSTMDFPTDADGHYVSVHPVDHWVEMQLALAFGATPAASAVGSTLREIAIGTREEMTADARRIATTALAPRIATGDVVLVSVVAWAVLPNRARVEITYQNTRAPDADRNRTVVQ